MEKKDWAAKLARELIWLFTEAIGYIGIVLIGYSAASYTEPCGLWSVSQGLFRPC